MKGDKETLTEPQFIIGVGKDGRTNMGDNLKIHNLRNDLRETLNASLLPIEVKRMLVTELLNEVTRVTQEMLQKELEAEQSKEGEE